MEIILILTWIILVGLFIYLAKNKRHLFYNPSYSLIAFVVSLDLFTICLFSLFIAKYLD